MYIYIFTDAADDDEGDDKPDDPPRYDDVGKQR